MTHSIAVLWHAFREKKIAQFQRELETQKKAKKSTLSQKQLIEFWNDCKLLAETPGWKSFKKAHRVP